MSLPAWDNIDALPFRPNPSKWEAAADHQRVTVAIVFSRALSGVHAPLVTVEVHLAGGLPAFNLVGLPETEVKESRDRVRAALQNALFEFPQRRITVNL